MTLLLDSNIITYLLQERAPVIARFTEALKTDAAFVLSDVVEYEIRRYLLLKGATRQFRRYEALVRHWAPVSLTRSDWHTAAELWAELHQAGRSIEDRDLLIAVSALKEHATLVTGNTRHFDRPGVPLLDWTKTKASDE